MSIDQKNGMKFSNLKTLFLISLKIEKSDKKTWCCVFDLVKTTYIMKHCQRHNGPEG